MMIEIAFDTENYTQREFEDKDYKILRKFILSKLRIHNELRSACTVCEIRFVCSTHSRHDKQVPRLDVMFALHKNSGPCLVRLANLLYRYSIWSSVRLREAETVLYKQDMCTKYAETLDLKSLRYLLFYRPDISTAVQQCIKDGSELDEDEDELK